MRGVRAVGVVTALLAMAWTGGLAHAQVSAAKGPAYLKIVLSDKAGLFLQFQGDELRIAGTAEGLTSAPAVKATAVKNQPPMFKDVALPISAEALPAGVIGAKLTASVQQIQTSSNGKGQTMPYVFGKLRVSVLDAQKAEWIYEQSLGTVAATDLAKVQPVPMVGQDKLALAIRPQAKPDGSLGIGVSVAGGKAVVNDIFKAGAPADVTLRVLNAQGKELSSAKGALTKFGFS